MTTLVGSSDAARNPVQRYEGERQREEKGQAPASLGTARDKFRRPLHGQTETAGGTPALHGTGPSLLARAVAAGEGFAGDFFDGEEDIHGEVDDGFAEAAGPPDFERVHAGVEAEAEKNARVLRGAVAHRIVIRSAARP